MEVSVRWHSQRGNRTEDNRDCAGIGIAGDCILAIVADGATAGKGSGQLAQILVRDLVNWFAGTSAMVSEDDLSEELRHIHGSLARKFPRSSASYMTVVVRPQHPMQAAIHP